MLIFGFANGSPIGYSLLDNTDGYTWSYYWYEKNMQGDIIAVYDNDGTKLISYTYDAWGNFTITRHTSGWTEAEENPFTYRGYYYHHALGMYYLGTRWYDPVIGRFISPDKYVSTGQGILGCNMYAYCGNNPVNFVDPSGESALAISLLIAACVGATIGAASGAACAYMKGESVAEGALKGAITGGLIAITCELIPVILPAAGFATSACAATVAGAVIGGIVDIASQAIKYYSDRNNGIIDDNLEFRDCVDVGSIACSATSGAVSGCLGYGAGKIVSNAFPIEMLSAHELIAKGVASAWIGSNASLLSMGNDILMNGVILAWSE